MPNVGIKLPSRIGNCIVKEDGLITYDGMSIFPWLNEAGFIGGHARYRIVAEEVSAQDLENMYHKTQETQ